MKTPKAAKTVEELLAQVRKATKGGNYIFRGENKKYSMISSKLYRYFQTIVNQAILQETAPELNFDLIKQTLKKQLGEFSHNMDFPALEKSLKESIFAQLAQKGDHTIMVENIQNDIILKEIKEYVDFEYAVDTLAEAQHYGGSTNLIDFSYSLAVALFFACDGESQENGRLILLSADNEGVIVPKENQNNRILFQESVFVKRDDGCIEEHEVRQLIILKGLKPLLLTYVQNHFDIRTETIYGDLMGYIQNQEMHSEAYKQLFAGIIHHQGEIGEKNFKKAVVCYTKAIELKPNFAEAYSNCGNARIEINPIDLEGAIADYDKAIELNPNYADAYNNRGGAYDKKGEHDLAIADYDKAIELNPKHAAAYRNLGIVYAQKGEIDYTIAYYSKAIELNPNYIDAYHNRGIVYGKKCDNDLAIADFNKAIALNPKHADAYHNRGIAYAQKGEIDRAIADYNKAIELNPKHAAYYNRGLAYGRNGEIDRAIADYNKVIELNPDYYAAYSNRGNAYRKKGNYDRAIADFNKAILLNPNLVEAYANRGVAKRELLNFKGAKEDLETALQLAKQQENESLADRIQGEIDNTLADSDS